MRVMVWSKDAILISLSSGTIDLVSLDTGQTVKTFNMSDGHVTRTYKLDDETFLVTTTNGTFTCIILMVHILKYSTLRNSSFMVLWI